MMKQDPSRYSSGTIPDYSLHSSTQRNERETIHISHLGCSAAKDRADRNTVTGKEPTGHNPAPNIKLSPVLIGDSAAIRSIKAQIQCFAPTDLTVLITGETGTGKEVVAKLLHHQSKRQARPIVPVNCGAIPPELVESELFGHERGAYSGAADQRIGLLESAAGGTFFLDEIAETPLSFQVTLLRFLQEREIRRLGSNRLMKVDVRVVAATNRRLPEEVEAGRFREDLYSRLEGCEIKIPPLRQRREDIRQLAAHFALRAADGQAPARFTEEAWQMLESYAWPRNVRELEHVVETASLLCGGREVCPEHLPERVRRFIPGRDERRHEGGDSSAAQRRPCLSVPALSLDDKWHTQTVRLKSERAVAAKRKVDECGGNKSRAARALGITRQWLYRVLEETDP